jgi:hypothetical protein
MNPGHHSLPRMWAETAESLISSIGEDILTHFPPQFNQMYKSMSFAGYVSVFVQLYCVGFHCLSLHFNI